METLITTRVIPVGEREGLIKTVRKTDIRLRDRYVYLVCLRHLLRFDPAFEDSQVQVAVDFHEEDLPLGMGGFVSKCELFMVGGELVTAEDHWSDEDEEFEEEEEEEEKKEEKEVVKKEGDSIVTSGFRLVHRVDLSSEAVVFGPGYGGPFPAHPRIPPMVAPKPNPVVVMVDGKIYVLATAGYFSGRDFPSPAFEVFDPDECCWEQLPNPPFYDPELVPPCYIELLRAPIFSHFVLNKRIYVASPAGAYYYDIAAGVWCQGGEFFNQFKYAKVPFPGRPRGGIVEIPDDRDGTVVIACAGKKLVAYQFCPGSDYLLHYRVLEEFQGRPAISMRGFVFDIGGGMICVIYPGFDPEAETDWVFRVATYVLVRSPLFGQEFKPPVSIRIASDNLVTFKRPPFYTSHMPMVLDAFLVNKKPRLSLYQPSFSARGHNKMNLTSKNGVKKLEVQLVTSEYARVINILTMRMMEEHLLKCFDHDMVARSDYSDGDCGGWDPKLMKGCLSDDRLFPLVVTVRAKRFYHLRSFAKATPAHNVPDTLVADIPFVTAVDKALAYLPPWAKKVDNTDRKAGQGHSACHVRAPDWKYTRYDLFGLDRVIWAKDADTRSDPGLSAYPLNDVFESSFAYPSILIYITELEPITEAVASIPFAPEDNGALASKAICWASVSAIWTILFPNASKFSVSTEPGKAFISILAWELKVCRRPSNAWLASCKLSSSKFKEHPIERITNSKISYL
ncbi:hypothetical protein RJ640_029517 [Escallonia rubra]|uniref:Uncharacterized protein n=1 Tax=Escallonia rubra TaxID=112253 RepID=A0AA88RRW7_9ASTE|nr:hypothetical protein RJ640_029517 [Escallonia rubra]